MKATDRWKHEENARLGASTGAKSTGVKERGNVYHRKVYGLLELHSKIIMPGWKLHIEPWFRRMEVYMLRSPDAVLVHEEMKTALVVEVKLNWKDGRDGKLIREYLPIVKSAFKLDIVWPLLITQNIRGYKHKPLLGLGEINKAMHWFPGDPTPLMLLVR